VKRDCIPRSGRQNFIGLTEFSRRGRVRSPICSDEIEFSFLNGNLVVPRSRQLISMTQPGAAHLEKMQVNTT
jgi:hypothetical protein